MLTTADSTINLSENGRVATVASVATVPGRAVTANISGLVYFEVEALTLGSGSNWWGVGITRDASNLGQWIGQGSDIGVYIGTSGTAVRTFVNGNPSGDVFYTVHTEGTRLCMFVNTVTNKAWAIADPAALWRYGPTQAANPITDTEPLFVLQGSGPARIAVSPGFTLGNQVRLHTSRSSIKNKHLIAETGARTLATRSATVNLQLLDGSTPIAAGTIVNWAWFDEPTLNPMTDPPISYGTSVVASGGNITLPITTELQPGQTGLPILSTTTGNALEDCRSRLRPIVLTN